MNFTEECYSKIAKEFKTDNPDGIFPWYSLTYYLGNYSHHKLTYKVKLSFLCRNCSKTWPTDEGVMFIIYNYFLTKNHFAYEITLFRYKCKDCNLYASII